MDSTTPPSQSPITPNGGSALRLWAGVILLIVALAVAVFGFTRLVSVLDSGGYGTPPMTIALTILGGAGACLAAGIATLIWDIAKRYER